MLYYIGYITLFVLLWDISRSFSDKLPIKIYIFISCIFASIWMINIIKYHRGLLVKTYAEKVDWVRGAISNSKFKSFLLLLSDLLVVIANAIIWPISIISGYYAAFQFIIRNPNADSQAIEPTKKRENYSRLRSIHDAINPPEFRNIKIINFIVFLTFILSINNSSSYYTRFVYIISLLYIALILTKYLVSPFNLAVQLRRTVVKPFLGFLIITITVFWILVLGNTGFTLNENTVGIYGKLINSAENIYDISKLPDLKEIISLNYRNWFEIRQFFFPNIQSSFEYLIKWAGLVWALAAFSLIWRYNDFKQTNEDMLFLSSCFLHLGRPDDAINILNKVKIKSEATDKAKIAAYLGTNQFDKTVVISRSVLLSELERNCSESEAYLFVILISGNYSIPNRIKIDFFREWMKKPTPDHLLFLGAHLIPKLTIDEIDEIKKIIINQTDFIHFNFLVSSLKLKNLVYEKSDIEDLINIENTMSDSSSFFILLRKMFLFYSHIAKYDLDFTKEELVNYIKHWHTVNIDLVISNTILIEDYFERYYLLSELNYIQSFYELSIGQQSNKLSKLLTQISSDWDMELSQNAIEDIISRYSIKAKDLM